MEYCLSCHSYYEDENFYWFSEIQYNGFYQVDKKTLVPELLFHFPEEEVEQDNLFSQILKIGDWFVFAPQKAKHIILYHVLNKEIKKLPLAPVKGERKITYNPDAKFSSMVSYEGKVYLFPFTYPAIVVLDLKEMSVTYSFNGVDEVEKMVEEHRKPALNSYFHSALVEGTKVYLPSACSNQLVLFDLKNHQVDSISIVAKEQGFNGIAFDGSHFWLSPLFGNTLVKWSPEGSVLVPLEKDAKGNFYAVHIPLVLKQRLLLLPGFINKGYEVDLETKEVKVHEVLSQQLPQKQVLHNLNAYTMFSPRLVGGTLHFICGNDRNWYTYDLEKDVLSKKSIPMDEVGVAIMKQRSVFRTEIKSATLKDFCQFVIEMENKEIQEKAELTVGEKVLRATV